MSEAPNFSKPLKDFSCAPGQCCVLECRVQGNPTKVVWKREGAEIEDSFEFRTLHKGEICTLVIGELFPEDAGTFSCVASNENGEAETSCSLSVQGDFSNINSISTNASAYTPPKPPYQRNTVNSDNLPLFSKHQKNHFHSMTSISHTPKKEENDFKAEKDQLIKDVAKTVTTPKNLHPQYRKTLSPELAIINRDIEQRLQITSTSPAANTSFTNINSPRKSSSSYVTKRNAVQLPIKKSPTINKAVKIMSPTQV